MVSLNSIIMTTVIVFGVFDNYTYAHITDKWDHAVNSKDALNKALKNESTMIEADVMMGLLDNVKGQKCGYLVCFGRHNVQIPVMGHPPAIKSDLSLKEFLDEWNLISKTVKLNFKSTDAFQAAIPIMKKSFRNFKQPTHKFWLNADILRGPGPGDEPEVDADIFIRNSMISFPDTMLSLGWTTYAGRVKYTKDNIDEMLQVLDNHGYNKPVNFAVRASYAANAVQELHLYLMDKRIGSTPTIWCNDPSDVIKYSQLVHLVKKVGINQVYLDLPENISNLFFIAWQTRVNPDFLYQMDQLRIFDNVARVISPNGRDREIVEDTEI